MSRREVIVTVVAGVVLAILVAYGLMLLAFSGWGDPSRPTPSPTVGVVSPCATSCRAVTARPPVNRTGPGGARRPRG